MNSSVTWDSATSVMSSLCLEIRASSRSNGPSNTSRWTWKPGALPLSAVASSPLAGLSVTNVRSRSAIESPDQQAVLPPGLQVGEQDGHRLPDQAPPVGRYTVAAQDQPPALQVEQFLGGQ